MQRLIASHCSRNNEEARTLRPRGRTRARGRTLQSPSLSSTYGKLVHQLQAKKSQLADSLLSDAAHAVRAAGVAVTPYYISRTVCR